MLVLRKHLHLLHKTIQAASKELVVSAVIPEKRMVGILTLK
jgi:hypothetical protein